MALLKPFGDVIWTADGASVSFLGFRYPTRMAVIRLADGGLFIWSPIVLTDILREEVCALGNVAALVSPNKLHHLYLGQWKEAFPKAQLWASPGLIQKCPELPFDGELGNAPPATWADQIDQVIFVGSFALTEVVFFHRHSRTVLFCDLIQKFPHGWFLGWRGVLARLDGIVEPSFGPPREWRLTFLGRKKARKALERIISWHPTGVIVAHGIMARQNGEQFIRRAFRWL